MTAACPRPLARFVYVIGPEQGLQKIGLATDPHARLATLRTASPFELHVHAAIPVPFRQAHAVEQRAQSCWQAVVSGTSGSRRRPPMQWRRFKSPLHRFWAR